MCVQRVRTHQSYHLHEHSEKFSLVVSTVDHGNDSGPSNSGRNIPESGSSSNHHCDDENPYLMDTSKPIGDACREDGTLKDANEMDWPDSPTQFDHHQALIEEQFRELEDVTELELPASTGSEADEAPKVKVR